MRHLQRVVKSFSFAFAGLAYLLRTQRNFWVHALAGLCVVLLSSLLGLRGAELGLLVVTIGLVLVAEAVNTALEVAVDLASPQFHPLARTAKDVSAAAVLLAAATAVVVGFVVLFPKLAEVMSRLAAAGPALP